MRAMQMLAQRQPLRLADVPRPSPAPGQLLIRVATCGVCRTDLHVVDGDLTAPKLPLIPGHQIVGRVEGIGSPLPPSESPTVASSYSAAPAFALGNRVGVPWLGGCCGHCEHCRTGRENLCDEAIYTGYQVDGGFAEYCVADARFCFPIPEGYPDLQAAPLLCAGLIGYRALRLAGDDAQRIGFYGFGSAAHILTQVARFQGRRVYAFTRPGDADGPAFARRMGADWVGPSDEPAPEPLDAAIVFAPVGALVPLALRAVRKGGVVVCAGIYMSDIPAFPYSILWGERQLRSVANLTRQDGEEFLALAPRVPIRTEVSPYPLERVNEALDDLRAGRLNGAAVVVVDPADLATGK